jgi:hypothetical protein
MSATVKGNVALTNSHFLKDIDLIPIGLPGRPAPEPIEDRPDYSIKTPPLRDWKFDVAVKTKDPFSIRGNLATGKAIVDLHLGGTGSHPELKGIVKLQGVEATLPFSRLDVTNGFLYFDPSDSFNPKIDLHPVEDGITLGRLAFLENLPVKLLHQQHGRATGQNVAISSQLLTGRSSSEKRNDFFLRQGGLARENGLRRE